MLKRQVLRYRRTLDLSELFEQGASGDEHGYVRIRIHPQVFVRQYGATGGYLGWPGISYALTCESPAEAMTVRSLLDRLIELLEDHTPEAIHKGLDNLDWSSIESVPSLSV